MRHSVEFHRSYRTRGRGRRRDRFGVALIVVVAIGSMAGVTAASLRPAAPAGTGETSPRDFGLCFTGGGIDCVVDGDTFWIDGEKIRIADIDAPETHPPRCPREAELGNAATRRLQALLNAGPVTLAVADRDTDRYGRKLRIVM